MTPRLSDDPLTARIRSCLLDLLAVRGAGRSICPSEAAQALSAQVGGDWQELMRPIRTVAIALERDGVIEALQHEFPVDLQEARGPVRLRLRASPPPGLRRNPAA